MTETEMTVLMLADGRQVRTATSRAQIINMVNAALHDQVLITIKSPTGEVTLNPYAVVSIEALSSKHRQW